MLLATACPTLPAYHPDTLMQYAVWGELDRVRAILRHLYDGIVVTEASNVSDVQATGDATTGPAKPRPWHSAPVYLVDTLPPITLAGLLALPGVGAAAAAQAGLSGILSGGSGLASAANAALEFDGGAARVTSPGMAPPPAATDAGRYDALFATGDGDGADAVDDDSMEAVYARLAGLRRASACAPAAALRHSSLGTCPSLGWLLRAPLQQSGCRRFRFRTCAKRTRSS